MAKGRLFEDELDGTVVAAEDVGMDAGIGKAGTQALGDEEVVDAPAGILLACLEAVGPPRVGDLVGVEGAEGVEEAPLI